MQKIWGRTIEVIVFTMTLFVFHGAAAWAKETNLAWMSLLLANRMKTSSTVNDNVIPISDDNADEILGLSTDVTGDVQLQLSGDLAGSAQNGSILCVLPGADNRFPLGISGSVRKTIINNDGTKTVELAPVTYAEVFEEAEFNLDSIPLDVNNFVGVIAPSSIQAASGAARIAKSVSGGDVYSFRDGAIMVGASGIGNSQQKSTTIDGIIDAGTVSLNIKIDLADMDAEENNMSPKSDDTPVGFVITGSLEDIKLTNNHEFSLTSGLDSLELGLEGDFNFDVQFNGSGSAKFGYFSSAWDEVDSAMLSVLGVSAKLSGLSSDDKIGKYPIAGLVWSVTCPSTCPVVTGTTQAPLTQAKAMGVIVWLYLTLEGELSIDGELSLARLNPAELSLGIEKTSGSDFQLVTSLERKSNTSRLLEAPSLNGTFGAQLEAGITTDLDFFVSGVRIANAGMDLAMLGQAELSGNISYGTDSLDSPWSWEGDLCASGSIGAGAVVRASAGVGVEVDTSWVDVSGDFQYEFQLPTDEEMSEVGWHGAWYTAQLWEICVDDCVPDPVTECKTAVGATSCGNSTDNPESWGEWETVDCGLIPYCAILGMYGDSCYDCKRISCTQSIWVEDANNCEEGGNLCPDGPDGDVNPIIKEWFTDITTCEDQCETAYEYDYEVQ